MFNSGEDYRSNSPVFKFPFIHFVAFDKLASISNKLLAGNHLLALFFPHWGMGIGDTVVNVNCMEMFLPIFKVNEKRMDGFLHVNLLPEFGLHY